MKLKLNTDFRCSIEFLHLSENRSNHSDNLRIEDMLILRDAEQNIIAACPETKRTRESSLELHLGTTLIQDITC